MKKEIFYLICILFLFYTIFVYAQSSEQEYSSMSLEKRRDWIYQNLGIKIEGDKFNYNQDTNTLEISVGSTAEVPSDFDGDVIVKGGDVNIVADFTGNIEISNGGTVKIGTTEFSGEGSYSKEQGFTIKDGTINSVSISNGNEVKVTEDGAIIGIAAENCKVAEQEISEGSHFIYNDDKVTLKGTLGATTLPNANLEQRIDENGVVHYFFKDTNIELNVKDSKIFLAPGDSIKIENFHKKIEAEDTNVILFFENGYINPIRIFDVPRDAVSISEVFKDAGYGGDNYLIRKKFYEEIFPGETFRGTPTQNTKLLNSLKDGEILLFYEGDATEGIIGMRHDAEENHISRVELNSKEIGHIVTPTTKPIKINEEDSITLRGVTIKNPFFETPRIVRNGLDKTKLEGRIVRERFLNTEIEINGEKVKLYDVVMEISRRSGVPADVIGGVIATETAVQDIDNPGGPSFGYMQITEGAIEQLNKIEREKGSGVTWNIEKIKDDPKENIAAGTTLLSYLLEVANGNHLIAVSIYNSGEGGVSSYAAKHDGQIPNLRHVETYAAFKNGLKDFFAVQ